MLQNYLVCRPNTTERLDFYSLNSYEWCGSQATYQTSGYDILEAAFQHYPVPVFFSEDGCNTVPPRDFNDQSAIFGPNMANTWSGSIIYEWIEEVNNYGLVSYGAYEPGVNQGNEVVEGYVRQGVPTPIAPDFTNLQAQWATLSPTGVLMSRYAATVTTTPPSCPSYSAGGWTVDPSAPLPTLGEAGVTAGMPTNVPHGSITSISTSTATSSAHPKNGAPSISSSDSALVGMIVALITVGAGIAFWL